MRLGIETVLKSVQLENFRLFRGGEEGIRVQFHEKLTIFIGENGAGKTALLEGILPLLEILIARIKPKGEIDTSRLASETDINNEAIAFTNRLEIDLYPIITEDNLKAQWQTLKERHDQDISALSLSNDRNGENELIRISAKWYLSVYKDLETEIDSSNEATFEVLREVFRWVGDHIRENNISGRNATKHETELPLVVYYPCEKTDNDDWLTKVPKRTRETEYDAYEDALTKKSWNFQRFFSWFKGRENLERQDPSYQHLGFVKKAIYDMLNDDEIDGKYYDLKTVYLNYPEEGELVIAKKGSSVPIKVSQMSSGEKHLFALVSDIARRMCILNPHKSNPLQSTGIVLIDEIDLHLHPRWQSKVISQLQKTFPKVQFVVTTHSPFVLQKVNSESIRVLEGGNVLSAEPTKGQPVSTILETVMDVPNSLFNMEMKELFKAIGLNDIEAAKAKIAELEGRTEGTTLQIEQAKAVIKRKAPASS